MIMHTQCHNIGMYIECKLSRLRLVWITMDPGIDRYTRKVCEGT